MKIGIASDHRGYDTKEKLKKHFRDKYEIIDYGTDSKERTDYPIYAREVAHAVSTGECEKGILICRSGHGMAITANKFKGVRAAAITSEDDARFAKADDDINVITFGADCLETKEAIRMIRTWIATEFKGGRYQERIDMINEIEKENMK